MCIRDRAWAAPELIKKISQEQVEALAKAAEKGVKPAIEVLGEIAHRAPELISICLDIDVPLDVWVFRLEVLRRIGRVDEISRVVDTLPKEYVAKRFFALKSLK